MVAMETYDALLKIEIRVRLNCGCDDMTVEYPA